MNKITRLQGKKQCFSKKTQKHKILRRVEGQQPQKTRAMFFVFVPLVSSWSPIVFEYLVHCKSVTHLVFIVFTFGVFFLFLVVVFRFVVSIFVFIVLFVFDSVVFLSCIFSFCDPKNQIKSQNI